MTAPLARPVQWRCVEKAPGTAQANRHGKFHPAARPGFQHKPKPPRDWPLLLGPAAFAPMHSRGKYLSGELLRVPPKHRHAAGQISKAKPQYLRPAPTEPAPKTKPPADTSAPDFVPTAAPHQAKAQGRIDYLQRGYCAPNGGLSLDTGPQESVGKSLPVPTGHLQCRHDHPPASISQCPRAAGPIAKCCQLKSSVRNLQRCR